MIERALRYQTQGDDWVKRVAIGGGVVFLANLVFLPIFAVYGYMLEVMRRTLRGETDTPPEWGEFDIVEMSLDGVKAFAILFAYTTVLGLVLLLPSGLLLLLGAVLESPTLGLLGVLVGGALSLVGALLIAVIAPVAIGNFAITGDLGAGFDIGVLRRVGPNPKLLRAALLAVGISLLISLVSGVLFFTVVGPPLATFVGFSAITVIWANGFADAYREVYDELPEIPDGPMKQAGSAGTDTAATADENAPTTDDASVDTEETGETDDSDDTDDEGSAEREDGSRRE